MESESAKCLINSISRFILLVSSPATKPIPTRRDFETMAVLMKHLKPFLDEILNEKTSSPDQALLKECEKLDIDINEIREAMESRSPNASLILSVWRIELLMTRIRRSSLEICRMLCRMLRISPSTSTFDGVQVCTRLMKFMQELRNWQPNRLSTHIEQALKSQTDDSDLFEIIECLGLNSNQDLLKERIFIAKEKTKSQEHMNKEESDQINAASDLIFLIYDHLRKTGYFDSSFGFSVPSYFRCPLSLALMSDPVIVASGQTFERASIRKWVDEGLSICPVTGERLTDTDFITNRTIKDMIVIWLKENNRGSVSGSVSCSDEQVDRFRDSEIKKAGSSEQSFSHSRTQSISSVETSEPRTDSFRTSSDTGSDETVTRSYVEKLVEDLKSVEARTSAVFELRMLAKNNSENRAIIGKSGAIDPLISLMSSTKKTTQEHAVTAILNLSINDENKVEISSSKGIDSLIHVLKTGTDTAKENAAATLYSLASLEAHRIKIGRSGAVKPLVNLLGTGSIRAKKDATAALFNLSICHENKARIVQAGAVKYLVGLLDEDSGLVDKAIAVLTNLASVSEGRTIVVREGGIPLIIEVLEIGSRRGKENAASALLELCLHSEKYCTMVIKDGAVPPLVALSQTGTTRSREKALQLLSHFRSLRAIDMNGKRKIIKY